MKLSGLWRAGVPLAELAILLAISFPTNAGGQVINPPDPDDIEEETTWVDLDGVQYGYVAGDGEFRRVGTVLVDAWIHLDHRAANWEQAATSSLARSNHTDS